MTLIFYFFKIRSFLPEASHKMLNGLMTPLSIFPGNSVADGQIMRAGLTLERHICQSIIIKQL
jgi:hypothetical protein